MKLLTNGVDKKNQKIETKRRKENMMAEAKVLASKRKSIRREKKNTLKIAIIRRIGKEIMIKLEIKIMIK